jgi:hypothetical protein
MMQQGFANSDPRYRLSYLKVWLRAVGNTILDVRMQTMNMTDDEAMSFMMNDAFQTRAEAEGKLQRAKLSSTQLPTYYVGTSEWWRLRRVPMKRPKARTSRSRSSTTAPWTRAHYRFRGWGTFSSRSDMAGRLFEGGGAKPRHPTRDNHRSPSN